jgi:hypothetical protein
MSPMPIAKQREAWADIMVTWSNAGESIALTKDDLLAAVTALDARLDTLMAEMDRDLPSKAKTLLTARQKAMLISAVAAAKARAAVGEVAYGN